MAKVKIEKIIDNLDSQMKLALEQTIIYHFPTQTFDSRELFNTFKKMVSKRCNTWEKVSDDSVEPN